MVSNSDEPPSLPETIPYITNTYQVVLHTSAFLRRLKTALDGTNNGKGIIKYNLGGPFKSVYIVARGEKNIQAFLRGSRDLDSEPFIHMGMENLWGFSKKDADKFKNDSSGRLKNPNPLSGTTGTRYWAGMHQLYDEFLTKPHHANALSHKFLEVFNDRLENQFTVGKWTETSVVAFMKEHMFQASMTALFGTERLKIAPETHGLYWVYEAYAWHFFYGVPRWMFPSAYKARDELYAAGKKYLDAAWKNFDWNGQEDWEPHFGSRFARETARWMREAAGFDEKTQAGFFTLLLFALHSNTLPTCTWMLIYLCKDPELFQAVREEALSAYYSQDEGTGRPKEIDVGKLVMLPLLQSVFAETLRLHMSFTNIREARKDMVFDGYKIKKGSWMQAFTGISHREEAVWGREGHPADEFWVGRHLTWSENDGKQVPQFSIAGKGGDFYPFGGGTGMCPGRHFAKQEALVALAAIVTRFDVEFVEWTNQDGSKSDREARGDEKFAGAGTMPADRDMKIRWKRLW
ncbi:cytochrome P450 [Podospora australis]|uniref:Cytochrome P450 n=1 Tax=Podospora australis TaxID=1536484 RepID=A0AAN6WTR4_9PEZI|nr:cytochrome P450 [Podospora australis]